MGFFGIEKKNVEIPLHRNKLAPTSERTKTKNEPGGSRFMGDGSLCVRVFVLVHSATFLVKWDLSRTNSGIPGCARQSHASGMLCNRFPLISCWDRRVSSGVARKGFSLIPSCPRTKQGRHASRRVPAIPRAHDTTLLLCC